MAGFSDSSIDSPVSEVDEDQFGSDEDEMNVENDDLQEEDHELRDVLNNIPVKRRDRSNSGSDARFKEGKRQKSSQRCSAESCLSHGKTRLPLPPSSSASGSGKSYKGCVTPKMMSKPSKTRITPKAILLSPNTVKRPICNVSSTQKRSSKHTGKTSCTSTLPPNQSSLSLNTVANHTPTSANHGSTPTSVTSYTPTSSSGTQQLDTSLFSSEDESFCENQNVMSALKDVTSLLNTLVKRVEDNSNDIKSIKQSLKYSSSSSDSSKKHHIPPIVRSETRKVYAMMVEEDVEFDGFKIGPDLTFKSDVNADVAACVIKEVKSLNPSFQTCDIRESIYTYYKSLCQEESAERRGLKGIRQKDRRIRERVNRKLQERKVTLERSSLSKQDKLKWTEILTFEMMSSEEDASEDDESIIIRPPPWRSCTVNEFFKALDDKSKETKSKQAMRQTKARVLGSYSDRPKPSSKQIPRWAFTDND